MSIGSRVKTGVVLALSIVAVSAFSQRPSKRLPRAPKIAYFAVLDGGKEIVPIGFTENGSFTGAEGKSVTGDDAGYLSPKRTYRLIFGGAPAGSIGVVKKNSGDCAGSSATVSVRNSTAKLGGFVMGLATTVSKTGEAIKSFRRAPTREERAEIESIVRAEFGKAGVPSSAMKPLRYDNLTAIDVDHDGTPEFVGTFWAAPKKDRRVLLFFIAAKNKMGKYAFQYKDLANIGPDDVMSGDVADTDEMGGELLLDSTDVDGDGVAEIFTTTQAFEGRNFTVYKRKGTEWSKIYTSYDYRCAF